MRAGSSRSASSEQGARLESRDRLVLADAGDEPRPDGQALRSRRLGPGRRASRLNRSVLNILTRKRVGGWTRLGVAGLDSPQTVQLVAFPTVREGLLPAYEAQVVDGKAGKAYRSFVDAHETADARAAEPGLTPRRAWLT